MPKIMVERLPITLRNMRHQVFFGQDRQHTQHNEEGQDHSMILSSNVINSMTRKKINYIFNKHIPVTITCV